MEGVFGRIYTKSLRNSSAARRGELSRPEMTAVYTHGNFPKALEAQRKYMEQLLAAKPASQATR